MLLFLNVYQRELIQKYRFINNLYRSNVFFNFIKDRAGERSDKEALRKIFDGSYKKNNEEKTIYLKKLLQATGSSPSRILQT